VFDARSKRKSLFDPRCVDSQYDPLGAIGPSRLLKPFFNRKSAMAINVLLILLVLVVAYLFYAVIKSRKILITIHPTITIQIRPQVLAESAT
jgi:hypothetical protein